MKEINSVTEDFQQACGNPPNPESIRSDLKPDGTPYKTSANARRYYQEYWKRRAILDKPLKDSDSPDLDILYRSVDSIPTSTSFIDEWRREYEQKKVQRAMGKLSDQQRLILILHFGLGEEEPKSHKNIGNILNLTAARISQIEQDAFKKLRRTLKKIEKEEEPALDQLRSQQVKIPTAEPDQKPRQGSALSL